MAARWGYFYGEPTLALDRARALLRFGVILLRTTRSGIGPGP
jgi:hypothetical protein